LISLSGGMFRRLRVARNQSALSGMHIAMPHGVCDTIDPLPEVLGTAAQQTAHIIQLSPVPLVLPVSTELPHRRGPLTCPDRRFVES
jgi:hypothetical protein